MEAHIKKRGIIKSKITRLANRVAAYDLNDLATLDGLSKNKVKIHLEMLDQAWKEFMEIQDVILQHDEIKEDEEEIEYLNQEERYLNIKTKLTDIITFLQDSYASGRIKSSMAVSSDQLQLPKLNLPIFSGDYKSWLSFYDLFNASVHNNSSLSNSQKLYYLKSSLHGDPARLLKSLHITDANYNSARNMLEERYSNMRIIVRSHIHAMCSHPPVKSENLKALRQLTETFHENILALEALNFDIESWSPFLHYQLAEKLDDESRRQWELLSPGSNLQTYTQLYEFLEARCRALEATNSKPIGAMAGEYRKFKSGYKERPKIETTTYQSTINACCCCQGDHRLANCPRFIDMEQKQRTNFVTNAKLCFNCLGRGHIGKVCRSTATCRTCKRRHHTLLHLESEPSPSESNSIPQCGQCDIAATNVLLATAQVPVSTSKGERNCRALLDSGSQASFISEACVQRLGLKRHYTITSFR